MPPEVEESRAKPTTQSDAPPSFDFFGFHQAGKTLSDNNAQSQKDKPQSSIEITNPFSFNQGFSKQESGSKPSVGRASDIDKGASSQPAGKDDKGSSPKPAGEDLGASKKPDNIICVDGFCRPMTPAEMQKEAAKRAGKSDATFPIPPFDFSKYGIGDGGVIQAGHEAPADKTVKPSDSLKELPSLTPPGSSTGRSSIIDAYERRQGARQAGGGSLPPIDAIPNNPGSDVRPWTPPQDNNNNNDSIDPTAKEVIHLSSKEQLEKEIRNSKVPVIVDFFATWCGPCKTLGPRLTNLAREQGGAVKVIKVDGDQFPELVSQYGVSGYPTLVSFKNGAESERTSGDQQPGTLRSLVNRLRGR